jgi:hypothetical protein
MKRSIYLKLKEAAHFSRNIACVVSHLFAPSGVLPSGKQMEDAIDFVRACLYMQDLLKKH